MDRLFIAAVAVGLLAVLVHRQMLTLAWGLGRALSSVREVARTLDGVALRVFDRAAWILALDRERGDRNVLLAAALRVPIAASVLALAALWGGATQHAFGALTGGRVGPSADLERAAELGLAGAVATAGLWLLLVLLRAEIRARLFDLDRLARVVSILGVIAALALVAATRVLWEGALPDGEGPVYLAVLGMVTLIGLIAAAALGIAGLLEAVVVATGLLAAGAGLALRGLALLLSTTEGVLQVPRAMLQFLAEAGARRGPRAGDP